MFCFGVEYHCRRLGNLRGSPRGWRGFWKWRRSQTAATVAPVSAQVFRHQYRVVYADCTLGNHIYYSRYLDILEAARGEFFRHLGVPLLELQAQEILFPVVECHLRYKSPARYDDVLTVELWPTLVQGARLNFGFRIIKEDTLILEGETFHVCTGLNEKPRRVPEGLAEKLKNFLTTDKHG
jgi:acyl-CoA thioester hydrolase